MVRVTPYAPANPPSQGDILILGNDVLEALQWWGINMVHQAHKVLPEPGDYRPASWRDVVGLLMALIGLSLLVGMTLTM